MQPRFNPMLNAGKMEAELHRLGKSAVAGILDKKGGLRVVVTQRWRMRYHVKKGERLFVVPGYIVQEPIPWHDIAVLIGRVEVHIAKTLAPVNKCETCTACCTLIYIEDGPYKKASNSTCQSCTKGFGCRVYPSRPKACKAFECMWLESQDRNDKMDPELRPDRCGAVFTKDGLTNDPLLIECHGTPNADAWKWIDEVQRVGYRVKKVTSYADETTADCNQ
jgi:hypothetical protein